MRIGIVLPAHNADPWIADAIGSVLAQTHRDWVLRVVDDGSSDATAAIARRFVNSRIRLFQQQNSGVSSARNRGLAGLVADAVLFLDADDWLAPDALARLAAALDTNRHAVAACGTCGFVAPEAGFGGTPTRLLRGLGGDILERLLARNRFANGGQVLVRAAAARLAGGFKPSLAYGEDWEYFIRIALQGTFCVASQPARPILLVRRRPAGACLRLATEAASFAPCMEAIFSSPDLRARFGPRLAAIRARTEAENHWVIGRALVSHGRRSEGLARLRRSLGAKPSLRRLALTAALSLPAPGG